MKDTIIGLSHSFLDNVCSHLDYGSNVLLKASFNTFLVTTGSAILITNSIIGCTVITSVGVFAIQFFEGIVAMAVAGLFMFYIPLGVIYVVLAVAAIGITALILTIALSTLGLGMKITSLCLSLSSTCSNNHF